MEIQTATHEPTRAPALKKIVIRKPGAVRLTARCSNYCYGHCCCL